MLASTVSVLMLGACAVLARYQVQYWRDSQSLFGHAVAVTSNNVVALNSLGFYYRPDLWQARYGLVAVLTRQGKTQEAIQVRTNGSARKP